MKAKTKRKRLTRAEYAEKRKRFRLLLECNPSLTVAHMARRFDITEATAHRWIGQMGFKRWF